MLHQEIVGHSPAFQQVLNLVGAIAKSDSVTLIQGETGTGKEVIAQAIHQQSSRSQGPFVKLNCAAIPGPLLESELFGHERGAYTGACTQTKGRFQMADRGTLFLDEIGDLPLELQPKLLRALQEREFERLGSSPDDPRRRAGSGGYEPGSRPTGSQKAVSRRSLLPPQRDPHLPPASARTGPGYSSAGAALRAEAFERVSTNPST